MHDLRAAARSLRSTPLPTLVVVATLAVAIGANTAIFSVVNGLLLRPFGYRDDHRLTVIWATAGGNEEQLFRLSPADYRDLRDDAEAFDGQVALYRSIGSTVTSVDPPERVGSFAVTPRLFRVLGTQPAAGRLFSAEDERGGDKTQVVLTHASWQRRFGGDPMIVGKTVGLDGSPHTIIGVAEPGFQFPPGDDDVEVFLPMILDDTILLDRDHRMFDGVARLADGVTPEAARAELTALAARLAQAFPDTNDGWSLTLRTLRREILGDLPATVRVLAGAVFLVLLVGCANVASLLVARSAATHRELAVRAALGARPRDLARRMLAESTILATLGCAGGLVLASWGVRLLDAVMPADIPRVSAIVIDRQALVFAVGITLGAVVLSGVLPWLRSLSPDLVSLSKPVGTSGPRPAGGRRLRGALVIVQIALAVILVVGSGLLMRSFERLSREDPGFRTDGVASVAVKLPPSRFGRSEWRPTFETILERVRHLPGVHAAGAVSDLPMSDVGLGFELEFTVAGLDSRAPSSRPNADIRLVLPGYFEAMGIDIVRGRTFEALDPTRERPVAIVNQTVVDRYFSDIDPIGRSLTLARMGDVEIVGVAADLRHGGLQAKYESEVFLPYGRVATAEMHIVLQADLDTAGVARAVGGVLKGLDPQLAPSAVASLSDLLRSSIARPRFNATLVGLLAGCAALLAVFGIYGIVTYWVAQRSTEIGVRLALGAEPATTVRMIVRQALTVVLTGCACGLLGALAAAPLLRPLLHRVPPTDALTYGVVLSVVVVIGVIAAWIPARRVSRIDVIAALRGD